jgi:serine protease AprX
MKSLMKKKKTSNSVKRGIVLAIPLFAFLSFAVVLPSYGRRQTSHNPLERYAHKISPALSAQVGMRQRTDESARLPVIVRVNPEYFESVEGAARREIGTGNVLRLVNGYTARLTSDQIQALLDSDVVDYVTLDAAIQTHSAASVNASTMAAIGSDRMNQSGYTGKNVTVAVFDSGISTQPPDLTNGRIQVTLDFTSGTAVPGDPKTNDGYGHGTAIAGLIGAKAGGGYVGVAPEVRFLDLKVVNNMGSGTTSNLIKAIDWLIANGATYNVRVANFSLGHLPIESYKTDPLCIAVGRLVSSGIVVVASSGNNGKNSRYSKIYGTINSPGNHPAVITVSPINTRGAAAHANFIATTYGSRGPTFMDRLMKPDLCAPGNNIPVVNVINSTIANNHPNLMLDGTFRSMSGSSMASAYVTGTVALLLEANPSLKPNAVKIALLASAIKLTQPNILEQGNGLVNACTGVELARAANPALKKLTAGVSPKWTLQGQDVWAGGAVAFGKRVGYGVLVDPLRRGLWGSGKVWTGSLVTGSELLPPPANWADGFFSANSVAFADGIIWTDVLPDPLDGIIWSDGLTWTDEILPVDGSGDGVIWTDDGEGDGLVWSDCVIAGDPN